MSGPLLLPSWDQLAAKVPGITEPMRRYLEQVACVLRPGSVVNTDQTLRCFAAFLAEAAPAVTGLAQITRRHVEDFKPWLAARPGQNKPRLTPATIAHRLGTLRMFFLRIARRRRDRQQPGNGKTCAGVLQIWPWPPGCNPVLGPRGLLAGLVRVSRWSA